MIKHLLIFLLLPLSFTSSFSQSWNQIGTTCYSVGVIKHDPSNNNIYFGGDFCDINSNSACHCIAKWNGSTFQSLQSGMNGTYPLVEDIEFIYGVVVAGGSFSTAGYVNANNIAYWNGTSWTAMGAGTNGSVSDLCTYNGVLYVGGSFTQAGNINTNGLASWNGNWSAVQGWTGNYVDKMVIWNNQLCVLSDLGNSTFQFSTFNGNTWTAYPGFTLYSPTGNSYLMDLEVFNGHLFISGQFNFVNFLPMNSIAEFDGTNWTNAGVSGLSSMNFPNISDLCADGNNLFIGGYFDSLNVTYVHNVASYNGNSWTWLANYSNPDAYALDVFQGDMYVASRSWIYKIDSTLSVNETSQKQNPLKIFPVPVSDVLHFEIGKEKISSSTIYSLTGQKLMAGNNSDNNLPVSELPPGTYILEVFSKNASHRSLFVKE